MIFHPTPLRGAAVIEPERRGDERGWFSRLFCEKEMRQAGLQERFVQMNNSSSADAGTLRGLHYQLPPSAEAKTVRCIRGAFWDVIVDLRPDSETYRQWYGLELSPDNGLALYVPQGFAHGFITLKADSEALYLSSAFYDPDCERGLRWDDPAIGIQWPIAPETVSAKDAGWPDFDPAFHGVEQLRGLGAGRAVA